MLRMVATDLDGTLLRSDQTVSDRTRAILRRLDELGIVVVPATARQVRGIEMLSEQVRFTGWAATSNGSVVTHLTTGEILAEATMSVAVQRTLVDAVSEAVPGSVFFAVYDGARRHVAELRYQQLTRYGDHKRDPAEFPVATLAELVSAPRNKIAVRHPRLGARELLQRVTALNLDGVTISNSGAPFLDVTAAGVSKAWGLERLRAHLGIDPADTMAFGDERNDIEMLRWAGRAVAMPHALPEVRVIADTIATGNDHDGVAQMLEEVLRPIDYACKELDTHSPIDGPEPVAGESSDEFPSVQPVWPTGS